MSSHDMIKEQIKQERAIKHYTFWVRAHSFACVWSSAWPRTTDLLTNTGEDLLTNTVCEHGDEDSQLNLAATCTSLRGLVMDRLHQQKQKALTKLYLSGAMG